MGHEFLWIDQPEALRELVTHLEPGRPVALDTEADSLHHYRESVCLVQVTQGATHFLIDPLANLDFSGLWPALAPSTWVLHGADFDLRMLRRIGAPEPADVFDTMLAAQLLGCPAIGYAALVEQFFGVVICKKSQKADWSRRPLSEDMLQYAVQDTLHLEPLAEKFRVMLEEAGRLEWHRQSCARVAHLSQTVRPADPEEDWRISGTPRLSPGAQAILKRAWAWREREAEKADRPVFKVMNGDTLLELSEWADQKRRLPPYAYPHWPRRFVNDSGKRLAEAVEAGRADPPVPLPPRAPRPPRDASADRRFEELKTRRDKVATDLKLDPSLIANKTILQILASRPDSAAELIAQNRWCPWQAMLFELPSV